MRLVLAFVLVAGCAHEGVVPRVSDDGPSYQQGPRNVHIEWVSDDKYIVTWKYPTIGSQ